MATVQVRYIVHDVDAAIAFYTEHFGFEVLTHAAPAFADVKRDDLRLLLSGPLSSAGRCRNTSRGSAAHWRRPNRVARP